MKLDAILLRLTLEKRVKMEAVVAMIMIISLAQDSDAAHLFGNGMAISLTAISFFFDLKELEGANLKYTYVSKCKV